MSEADYETCRNAVAWLRARSIAEWLREQSEGDARTCVFDAGPALDEHGIPIKRRGCGCNGQPPVIPMKKCMHPLHPDPMPEGCEARCTHLEKL